MPEIMPEVMIEPMSFIDLAKQQQRIRPEIDKAIQSVLDHGQFIMGPEVAELERQLCQYTGAKHAISCASGTDALLMGLMAYGVGPGDAVLVPSFTFPATPEVVALLGATPIFVDVHSHTFNIDVASVEKALSVAKAHDLHATGILAVDLYGLPADYRGLAGLAKHHGLWVMGDAAQSFGASAYGHKVGTLAEITATSFFPAKPLGCYGDGGCVFTDNDALAALLRSIRVHGKGKHKYDNVRIGINGRLDTIQAAILLQKLAIYPDEFAARQRLFEHYAYLMRDLDIVFPQVPDGFMSAWAQYTLCIPENIGRDALQAAMRAEGVPTMVYYPKPLHQQEAYKFFPQAPTLQHSEALSLQVLSLPMHPYLAPEDQRYVVEVLKNCLSRV